MSAVNEWRELADDIRSIPGSDDFGLRENACFLVTKKWTGERPGDGDEETTLTPLTVGGQNPKIKFPNQRDVALGLMSLGEVMIGPLTPAFPGGGTNRAYFDGSLLSPAEGLVIRIVPPDGGDSSDYKVNYTNTDSALRVMIKCTNVTMSGE
jgi:hypothetical protein